MHTTTTDCLSWDAPARTFTAEASELGLEPGGWPDTIRVTNPKTSNAHTFYRVGADYNAERELIAVSYETTLCGGMKLRVFND